MTGLSTAYHLESDADARDDRSVTVIERDDRPGGVCRSDVVDGFTFDHTGHLLHFKDPRIAALIDRLLPDKLLSFARRSSIWRDGVKTEYPFQVNTHGHPPEVVADCVVGFVEALTRAADASSREGSFKQWILSTFGAGFAEHFFLPYNEKFWRRDLSEITADWVSWAIPRPELRAVVEGALGTVARGLGYNPDFRCPKRGGIGQLPDALAARVGDLRLGVAAEAVDTGGRKVRLSDGTVCSYDRLVTTLPLPVLVRISDLPEQYQRMAGELDHIGVINFNVGIDRADAWPDHWTYFPEPDLPFYRVGTPTNFSTAGGIAPPGTTAYYVEVTYRPDSPVDPEELWPTVRRALHRVGCVRPDDTILVRHIVRIPHAYVVFDEARKRILPELQAALAERGIHSVGRYGGWEYSSMEKALLDGLETAGDILRGR